MNTLDFRKIDIAQEEDWKELENEWNDYTGGDEGPFAPIREKLSSFQTIVGFGRGFWGGAEDYHYLIYHKETDRFYWYLRNIQTDTDVRFYEFDTSSPLLSYFKEYSTEQQFHTYDTALRMHGLDAMAQGRDAKTPFREKPVSLSTLFGEDTHGLRIALMQFRPGGKYPHRTFSKRFYEPYAREEKYKKASRLNNGPFRVVLDEDELYIVIGEETFKLNPTRRIIDKR